MLLTPVACPGAGADAKLNFQIFTPQTQELALANPKQEESFRVIDRRLFNTEGEIRDEAVREERRKQETEPSPASPLNSSSAGAQKKEAAATKPSQKADSGRPPAAAEAEQPKPSRGIDMLDALREASRSNLASDDERLLLDVLGSLKLSYMEMTKAAAKAMQEKAKARP